MLTSRQKKEMMKRLRYISGQLAAIEQMVEQDRSPEDIYVQLLSIESAFTSSVMQTFETEHRKALAALIVERQATCPGSTCGACELVRDARSRFPNLTAKEVLHHLALLTDVQ